MLDFITAYMVGLNINYFTANMISLYVTDNYRLYGWCNWTKWITAYMTGFKCLTLLIHEKVEQKIIYIL